MCQGWGAPGPVFGTWESTNQRFKITRQRPRFLIVCSCAKDGCPRSRLWDLGKHEPKVQNHASKLGRYFGSGQGTRAGLSPYPLFWLQYCSGGIDDGHLLSTLRDRITRQRALLLQLRRGSSGGAGHARQAAGPSASAARSPVSASAWPRPTAGMWLWCASSRSSGSSSPAGWSPWPTWPAGSAFPRSRFRTRESILQLYEGNLPVGWSELGYRETGAGLPRGLSASHAARWRVLAAVDENLAGVRAIVPDLRGHGASELGGISR